MRQLLHSKDCWPELLFGRGKERCVRQDEIESALVGNFAPAAGVLLSACCPTVWALHPTSYRRLEPAELCCCIKEAGQELGPKQVGMPWVGLQPLTYKAQAAGLTCPPGAVLSRFRVPATN